MYAEATNEDARAPSRNMIAAVSRSLRRLRGRRATHRALATVDAVPTAPRRGIPGHSFGTGAA